MCAWVGGWGRRSGRRDGKRQECFGFRDHCIYWPRLIKQQKALSYFPVHRPCGLFQYCRVG